MSDNPSWKPILDAVPELYHPVIKPILTQWDQGVQTQLQKAREDVKPYEAFIKDRVDPERIAQALKVAHLVETTPQVIIDRLNQFHNLGYVTPDEAAKLKPAGDLEDEDYDGVDISKHPEFQAMRQMLERVNSTLTTDQQARQQQEAEQAFENAMDELEEAYKDKGGFDRTFVSAYVAAGWNPDDAVEQYQKLIAEKLGNSIPGEEQDKQTPPGDLGVLGNEGTAGSGAPDATIDWSKVSENDLSKQIAQVLEAANANEN